MDGRQPADILIQSERGHNNRHSTYFSSTRTRYQMPVQHTCLTQYPVASVTLNCRMAR